MATLRPFRALRPVPEKAGDVASVPYDVVTTEEARELAAGNPLSFLHVTRSEIDLPAGTYPYDEKVYLKARENLRKLIDDGVIFLEEEPCLYLYRLRTGKHDQVGVAACCSVDEYDNNTIRKHEHTRKEKEDDRLKHMLAISAHAGPVLLTYRGTAEITSLVTRDIARKPLYDFTASDGVKHTIWKAESPAKIADAFRGVAALYIADGHHRAAGASRVKKEMLKRYPLADEDEEFNYFLAVAFPSDQLRILPYNRYVSDLNGMSAEQFLDAVEKRFEIIREGKAEPQEKGQFGIYLGTSWYLIKVREHSRPDPYDPVARLDLNILQKQLLEPLLGIVDQKKDRRIDFIGGPSSSSKLQSRVDAKGGVAFTHYPVAVEELLAVSDAGMVMPPKSTWFSPKLRSGLLIHQF